MIKLNQLLKEETFTATNKQSGKTSVFKSKDSRDAAIKAGTHDAVKDKEQPSAPKAAGSDMFGGDYAKDRGGETPKADAGKKERKGNPQVNKATKSKAEELGVTPQKLGNKEYPLRMLQAAYEALTDSNYHTEARELIAKIEGKPEMAEKPDYPSMKDPKFKEKMAAISQKYASKYSDDVDDNARELGISASQEAGWGGVEAADAIAFTLRMNGFHKEADLIQSVFDNKPYMKNEGMIKLTKLMENDPCWKGYKQVGMKDKNGKEVPNCVPEGVVKEAGIPKLFLKIEAVKKKIKELMDARKAAVIPYNKETDAKRKEALKQPLIKLTGQIKAYEKNLLSLLDMEEKYIQTLNQNDELELA
jgi:hypothetical protein